jgi:hypothetical protein
MFSKKWLPYFILAALMNKLFASIAPSNAIISATSSAQNTNVDFNLYVYGLTT